MAKSGSGRAKATFREHPVEFILQAFADVRAGEAGTVLLLTLNVFILLCAYYFLKVAREPLILHNDNGAEVKSYASAAQAAILVVLTFAYGWLARHVGRMKLIACVTLFFVGNLVVFFACGVSGVDIAIPYYVWVGIYSLTVIPQFWAFAADIYDDEQGKRLFPIVGVGASLGSIVGTVIPKMKFLLDMGPYVLMVAAAVLLSVGLVLTFIVNKREDVSHDDDAKADKKKPLGTTNGFSLLFKDKYLLLIGLLGFVLNWVNTNGEYIMDRTLEAAKDANAAAAGLTPDQYLQDYKSTYFLLFNVIGFVLQLFVVSRVFKYVGVRGALFIMPALSFAGYSGIIIVPALTYILIAKVAENSVDYSLQNTSMQALWLVVPRESKYKVKQITDAIFVRLGDMAAAGIVLLGTTMEFSTRNFAMVNALLVVGWLAIVWFIGKKHDEREPAAEKAKAAA